MMTRRGLMGAGAGIITGCAAAAPTRGTAPAPATEAAPAGAPRFEALAGFCDGIGPPTAAEHALHRQRAQERMKSGGFRGLVVEPGPTMTYLSGVGWGLSERPFLMVLFDDGPAAWICPAFEQRRAEEETAGLGEMHVWQEHESPYSLVRSVLDARAVRRGIGVDPAVRSFVADGVRAALGAELDAAAEVVRRFRMVKTEAELGRLRRANEATKRAMEVAARELREGMTEDELRDIVVEAQEHAGLTDVWALVLFGPNAAFPHGTGVRRALARQDVVLVDTGGALHGYQSDVTRTWVHGPPTDEQRRAWDTVKRAQSAAMEKIRAGTACEVPDAAARSVVEESGYGTGYERFTHRLGHGIGLEGHEHPYLVKGNDTVLEPGMTMSNEPGIYLPGVLGVRIEDIVAVTAAGVEVLGPRSPSIDAPFGEP
jgi:Xaa-Pro aminopeptidase